ncbi:hypothetical protein, partial [uncultured Paracoccus sp.]|uniref:hypothetical protein n=1 Tax=uncultured Paracoccus sp. TaxID=189685 RepID=UPI002591E299
SDHHAVQGEAEYVERHAPITASHTPPQKEASMTTYMQRDGRITSAATDDMPERIWLDTDSYNGAVGFAHPEKHKRDWWAAYIRADLCASGQHVRTLNRAVGEDRKAGWTLPVGDLSAIKHHVYHEDGEIVSLEAVEIIALEVERRILLALTPSPQPETTENYADPGSSSPSAATPTSDTVAELEAEIERLTKAHDTVCGALAEVISRAEKAEAENQRLREALSLTKRADDLREVYHRLPNERNRIGDKRSRKSHARDAWLRAFRKAAKAARAALSSGEVSHD